MKESELQHQARLWLGSQPELVVFRNNVGTLQDRNGQHVRYGLLEGSCDLIGILKPSGRFFAMELKSATGRVSEKQQLFISLVRTYGGFACVARDMDEVKRALDRAVMGLDG